MAAPSYLASFLWSQQLRGAAVFAAKFPGEWLIWEPGAWKASPRGSVTTIMGAAAVPAAPPAAPRQGDALCFFLGAANGRTLDVGRNPECAIVINDGTVSRQHLLLNGNQGVWIVQA